MKSYISIKPGATFFLGSSRTLVYHKDDVEIIYKTKFIDAVNNLYLELNSHCPLKLWKDRLVAVWGQETL